MLNTIPRLGLGNVARVFIYRISLKLPFSFIRRVTSQGGTATGPFFHQSLETAKNTSTSLAKNKASRIGLSVPKIFGYHDIEDMTNPPNWLANPLNGRVFKNSDKPFFEIADFDPLIGDIKQIWELSRFGWLMEASQDSQNISLINSWLTDWLDVNQPYQGPNWKCGQEASLRVIHLIATAHRFDQIETSCQGLQDLVAIHLKRIFPTISYAIAQDNNHGTSEATALYVGGSWLSALGYKDGDKWARAGRRLLENRAAHLIGDDGSFSQYSTVYHRIMLDCYSFAQWWRRRVNDSPFSPLLEKRLKLASEWLYRLTNLNNGDAPNLGANDGAHILNFAQANYRDFRPSISMAYALWHDEAVFFDVPACQMQCASLAIDKPEKTAPLPITTAGEVGGFTVLKTDEAMAVLRCPRFQFRPSQSDILHLDFSIKDRNILRDGGTFSYNSGAQDLAYFGGVKSHNTACFDDRDQMPRLGRFLFGAWPKLRHFSLNFNEVVAAYKDYRGAIHERQVALETANLVVKDKLTGSFSNAHLSWRFAPDLWISNPVLQKASNMVSFKTDGLNVRIEATMPIFAEWEIGEESRYYLQRNDLPVLKIKTEGKGKITTHFEFRK